MKWYELDPDRLTVERTVLARYYPDAKMTRENGIIRVEIYRRTRMACYLIKAEYSYRFPYSPMDVSIVEPPIQGSPPHYFSSSKQPCLYSSDDVGPQTTVKVYLDWAIQWIMCYENWLDTGRWPETNKGFSVR